MVRDKKNQCIRISSEARRKKYLHNNKKKIHTCEISEISIAIGLHCLSTETQYI